MASEASSNSVPNIELALYRAVLFVGTKEKLKVDWNVVAQHCSYSNGNTASTRFGQYKKKFLESLGDRVVAGGGQDTGDDGDTVSTMSTPSKGKSAAGKKTTPKKIAKKPKKSSVKNEAALEQAVADATEAMDAHTMATNDFEEDSYVA